MMYNINPYVEVFKMARDMMTTEGAPMDLKLCFIAFRTKDARRHNVSTADEVAALMVRNGSEAVDRRDVVRSWPVSVHFRTTCGIHGSTLSVAISLR